jgi:predicted RNase H-like HicB family nuclease
MDFTALIHNDEDGGFWAEVEELPGCITQGASEEELEANLHEAIELFLEGLIDDYVESLGPRAAPESPDAAWQFSFTLKRVKAAAKS